MSYESLKIFIGVIPLAVLTILPCHGEPPVPSSYAVPPREGPSPSYGPPTVGSNSRPPFGGSPSGPPSPNYGAPSQGAKPGGKPPAGAPNSPSASGGDDSGSEGAEVSTLVMNSVSTCTRRKFCILIAFMSNFQNN